MPALQLVFALYSLNLFSHSTILIGVTRAKQDPGPC